ncbi:MAG: putative lipid II flippase FtsW [Oscillospiraceae bacterium]|nr:putative lipid II flippase FtsW [Oscillospiraceae bacterium]
MTFDNNNSEIAGLEKSAGSKKHGRIDATFFLLTLILLTIGLIMLFSAGYYYAQHYRDGNSFHFIQRQAIWAGLGLVLMIIFTFINYQIFKKLAFITFAVSVIMLIIVLFMPPLNNARRWISIGPINFQPSEVAKFAIILLFAFLISKNYKKMPTFSYGVLPFVFFIGIVSVLMMMQTHLSGTVLIMAIGFLMMFVGGTKYRYFLLAIAVAAVAVIGLVTILGVGYVQERLSGWIDPFSDTSNSTHQTYQSLLTIGSGGLLGVGLGGSNQKFLYLPEPQNDFIFSVVCEELGFIGAAIIIILFALFVYRGFVIASKAPDKFGMMMAVGITGQIGIQALLNIAVVTNTVPNTGISLPFFSYGGTALMMQLAQIGIVLNISRRANMEIKG